jgi:hypothetical protein
MLRLAGACACLQKKRKEIGYDSGDVAKRLQRKTEKPND